MASDLFGPKVEIRRGSWEERLGALLRERGAKRCALVLEPGEVAVRLANQLRARLPGVVEIAASGAPLRISDVLPALLAEEAKEKIDCVCIVGEGDRKDARAAGFKLGPLAERLWVFAHAMVPPSGLVPTIGEKVAKYLEVIEGLAFSEGPRDR